MEASTARKPSATVMKTASMRILRITAFVNGILALWVGAENAQKWIATERYRHPLTEQHYIRFVGHINDCRTCPLQKTCMRKPPKVCGRQVSILLGREENSPRLIDLMKEKIDSRKGRLIYSKRIGTIEPVFAHIRSTMRLDRFRLRGQLKVNAQWLLFCMVHNIKKIQKYSDYLPQGVS